MKRKIFFITVFSLLSFLFFVSTSLAANSASTTISPTLSYIGQSLTYTYTITNDGSSTANIGSAEIQLPVGFGTPSISISSASSSRTWVLGSSGGYVNGFNLITGKIGIQADGISSKLDFNEFVTIQITTTASATPNSYKWIASVWANLGFTGTSFPLSSQPTVNVITPTLSSIAISTPATKLDYNVGEVLDISLLEVTGTYSDDSEKVEEITADNIIGFNSSSPATDQVLTITVEEQTTTYTVNINNALDSVGIHLDIETNNGSLYDNDISVTACDSDNDPNTPDTITPYCAIKQLENLGTPILSDWSWYGTNAFVNSIGGVSSDFNNSKYWTWLANLDFSNFSLAASQYELHPNDQILFYFDTTPLKISDINLTPEVGSNLDIKVAEPDYGPWPPVWVPSVGGKIVISSNSFDLDSNGEYKLNITSTDSIIIKGQKNGYINSPSISIIPVVSNEEEDNNGENNGNEGSGSNPPISHHKVDIDKALRYLSEKQNSDGAFSSSMYTDWVAIAATAGDDSSLKSSLLNYIKANPLNSSSITDNERHAMALMSLGINPYSGTEINYIKKIVDAFDGTQFGDPDEFNDDIFAIFPLIKAGYDMNDEMIQKDISFILSKQENDGSWVGVDLTAATIQALSLLPSSEVITQAKIEAEQYLKNSQQADGGFGNSFATSWTLQAISALGEDSSTWTKNDLNPNDYLYSLQQNDGGIEPLTSDENVRIWATYDVVPAVLGKSWGDIMDTFSKPETEEDNPPRSGLGGKSSSNSLVEKEEKNIIQNDLAEVSQINKVVLPEIKKVSNPKVVVKDTTPEKKTVDIPEPSNNVDLDNNLLASAGSVNLGNFFKDKVIIMTIILTLVIFIGGWFVIKS